jgi:hypothetical protein
MPRTTFGSALKSRILSAAIAGTVVPSIALARAASSESLTAGAIPAKAIVITPAKLQNFTLKKSQIVDRVRQKFNPLQRISPHRLSEPDVVPYTDRAKAHVKISEANPEQTEPCPEHVTLVETSHASISAIARW